MTTTINFCTVVVTKRTRFEYDWLLHLRTLRLAGSAKLASLARTELYLAWRLFGRLNWLVCFAFAGLRRLRLARSLAKLASLTRTILDLRRLR